MRDDFQGQKKNPVDEKYQRRMTRLVRIDLYNREQKSISESTTHHEVDGATSGISGSTPVSQEQQSEPITGTDSTNWKSEDTEKILQRFHLSPVWLTEVITGTSRVRLVCCSNPVLYRVSVSCSNTQMSDLVEVRSGVAGFTDRALQAAAAADAVVLALSSLGSGMLAMPVDALPTEVFLLWVNSDRLEDRE